MGFILCTRHLRPEGAHADSHTASVRTTARTRVTIRGFPVKETKVTVALRRFQYLHLTDSPALPGLHRSPVLGLL